MIRLIMIQRSKCSFVNHGPQQRRSRFIDRCLERGPGSLAVAISSTSTTPPSLDALHSRPTTAKYIEKNANIRAEHDTWFEAYQSLALVVNPHLTKRNQTARVNATNAATTLFRKNRFVSISQNGARSGTASPSTTVPCEKNGIQNFLQKSSSKYLL